MADYWSKDDNYLDWLKDEARVVREEEQNRLDNLREPEEADWSREDEDEDDWTREDERAATRECF